MTTREFSRRKKKKKNFSAYKIQSLVVPSYLHYSYNNYVKNSNIYKYLLE